MEIERILIYILIFLILFFWVILSIYKKKIIKNYYLIFNCWWIIWLFISIINLGEFYLISLNTYLKIFFGLFFFNITMMKKNKKNTCNRVLNLNRLKKFYILEIIYFLINIYMVFKIFKIVDVVNEYWKVRLVFYGIKFETINMQLFSRSIYAHIYNFFKVVNLINFIFSLILFFKYNKKKLLILCILNIGIYCFVSGGREFIAYIIILAIFLFKAKLLKKGILYIGILIFFTLIMTLLRERSLDKIWLVIVTYYSGAIAYMDNLFKEGNFKFYNGELFFSGIIAPIKFLLKRLSINAGINGISEVGEKLMKFIQISETNTFFKQYNALATMYFWFYLDFGIMGIIGYSFFLGKIYYYIYSKINKNLESIAIMAYLEYLLIQSIFINKFMDLFTLLSILLIFYVITCKKYMEGKKC